LYVHKAEIKQMYSVNSKKIASHLLFAKRDQDEQFVIAAAGAGPGTDFVSFLEWLHDYRRPMQNAMPSNLIFLRIDKEDNWGEQYLEVLDSYTPIIDVNKLSIDKRKLIVDMFQPMSKKPKKRFDILSMSYVLSENCRSGDGHQRLSILWDNLKTSFKEKSIFTQLSQEQKVCNIL